MLVFMAAELPCAAKPWSTQPLAETSWILASTSARRQLPAPSLYAHQRLDQVGPQDVFSYNVFSCSKADLVLIGRLQREHFQRIRAIIAKSSTETVALLNMQLMQWPLAD